MTTETATIKDWKKINLGDYCKIYQPKTITSKQILKEGPYKVYGANGVIGFFDKYNHKNGEVLVTCRGATCGKVNFSEPKSWVTGNAMVIQPFDEKIIDKNFLYFNLLGAHLESLNTGSAQPQITRGPLFNFNLEIPNLPEQKSIARVLTVVQEAIAGQEELIAKLKELKRGMMQYLFTHGTKGEKTKITKLGEMPESWSVSEFGKFAEFKNGINFSKSQKGTEGIKTIDVFNMYGGNGSKIKLNDLYKVNKKISDDYLLKRGDILFVRSSLKREGVGWACYFEPITNDQYTFCGFIIRARLDAQKIIPEFATLYFRTELARTSLISGSGKVAITNINQGILSKIEIPIPSQDEQRKIVFSINSIDQKIEVVQEKLLAHQNLFKTLLHELMSGERRV